MTQNPESFKRLQTAREVVAKIARQMNTVSSKGKIDFQLAENYIEEALAKQRRENFEEAAKVAENYGTYESMIAQAIRLLGQNNT